MMSFAPTRLEFSLRVMPFFVNADYLDDMKL